ncbi:hypothetical protein TVAG_426170 [Trichomonas vaginalis G3]|uniref:Uncharacterized protein n=1 Tax=Trichomonas vaginalis (strain ATCC PRA-98 / G3) TaxID=412133 RepID=A2DYN4_TRIV3|nr:hypothetical protein TVAGG3_0850790 [Trichomonas vaginalis G3]EAY14424.1 hypothetical protein TVAG_426170 [Trichomonas vaginalis G3]KAI5499970.1 hypothetical protein TVAGG3_0850790 [Trichomonas vaginalis G3]|eukprot:XP_001326647.1 hypothetical protein [Trichomonas vaginalis G3]
MSSTNIIRVTLPDKAVQFIEIEQDGTFGDVCSYVRKLFDVSDSMVLIPQTENRITDTTKIGSLFTDKILHISVKNSFDHEAQAYLDSISHNKTIANSQQNTDRLKKHKIIHAKDETKETPIPIPISSLLTSIVEVETEPDYNRYNYK